MAPQPNADHDPKRRRTLVSGPLVVNRRSVWRSSRGADIRGGSSSAGTNMITDLNNRDRSVSNNRLPGDPFAMPTGRARLLVNGHALHAVTHEDFLDWCDEEADGAFSPDFEMSIAVESHDSLQNMVTLLTLQVKGMAEGLEQAVAISTLLLSRRLDPTHLSVPEAAKFKGVSDKTIRNWLAEGKLTREIVPGTRQSGIPVGELFEGWMDARRVKDILAKRAGSR